MKIKNAVVAGMLALGAGISSVANAETTIDMTSATIADFRGPFGGGFVWRQTFVAPSADTILDSILYYTRQRYDYPVGFQYVELYDWNEASHTTGQGLWFSGPTQVVSPGFSAFQNWETSLSALQFAPGVSLSGGSSYALQFASAYHGAEFLLANQTYSDGILEVFNPNAGAWQAVGYGDAAVKLSFSTPQVAAPVPEPETYAMMLAGLGLLGLSARRRKQKLNA